jgi:hypothetical protein
MAITLEQIEQINDVIRSRLGKARVFGDEQEIVLKEAMKEALGNELSLEELLDMVVLPEERELALKQNNDSLWRPYTYAFFFVGQSREREKRIDDLIEAGVLKKGDDKETLQYNISKLLMLSKDIWDYYPNDFFDKTKPDFKYVQEDAKMLLERLYSIIGRPKNHEDIARVFFDFPMRYFGLEQRNFNVFKAKMLAIALSSDNKPDEFTFHDDLGFRRLAQQIKDQDTYDNDVVRSLNEGSSMKQELIHSHAVLPLASAYHGKDLYVMCLEGSEVKIIKLREKERLAEMSIDQIRHPFSLAAFDEGIVFVNDGKANFIGHDLETIIDHAKDNALAVCSNDDILYEIANKHRLLLEYGSQEKFDRKIKERNRFSPEVSRRMALAELEETKNEYKLYSITSGSRGAAALLYSRKGDYVIVFSGKEGTKITHGKSYVNIQTGVPDNVGTYSIGSDTLCISMSPATYPPSVAMTDNAILVSEGSSIRVLDYKMKERHCFRQSEGNFELVDMAHPFSVIAGNGNLFGLYASISTGRRETRKDSSPAFLIFSIGKNYNVKLEGALNTEEMPMNIATGIAFSGDGKLAISGTGGRVKANSHWGDSGRDYVRPVKDGRLEVYQLDIPKSIDSKPLNALKPAE